MIIPGIEKCSPGLDEGPFVLDGQVILPWPQLKERYQIEWCCIQGGLQNIDQGYDSMGNIIESRRWVDITGTYYWSHPWATPALEAEMYDKAVQLEQPDFIWIDVEEVVKTITPQATELYTDSQITKVTMAIYERLKKNYPKIHITLYTRPDVITVYAPSLKPLCQDLDHISLAAWPDYGLDVYYQQLTDVHAGTMKECLNLGASPPRPFKMINIFDGVHGPETGLFPKVKVAYWQHSSRIRPAEEGLKGIFRWDHGYDFDVVTMTHAEHLVWLGKSEAERVTPPPEAVIPVADDMDRRNSKEWKITITVKGEKPVVVVD